jgi:hypothetical protein
MPCPAARGAVSGDIEFEYSDASSIDLSGALLENTFYPQLDGEKYGSALGRYLIQEAPIPLSSGDWYRLLLVCSTLDSDGGCRGIGFAVVDERKTPAAVIQRVSLGDGYAPQFFSVSGDGCTDIMFRTIRANDNTEARVYELNPVTGRVLETLAITRAFPELMKFEITGLMKFGGIVEAESKEPQFAGRIDLSGAIGALIEDELYQPDGNPIGALENLRVARGGWEDERIYSEGGENLIDVGMSLITLSGKPVLDVTAVLEKGQNGAWMARELRFEPSLPYRLE